jgi:glycosyltransferase involved in cell wall biosynthesis
LETKHPAPGGEALISIVTVSFNCKDWIELLVKSVRKFTTVPYELIVVDNASRDDSGLWLAAQSDVRLCPLVHNIGHGAGLDYGIARAVNKYILVMDADAHLQRQGWEADFLALYESNPKTRLIAAAGGDPNAPNPKPIHACFQFFEREFFLDNHMSFIPGKYDVGRKNYYDVTGLGFDVCRVPAGVKFYPNTYGDEYYIGGQPTLFHMWYSSRMSRIPDGGKVDNYTKADYERNKAHVFSMDLVRGILS